MVQNFRRSISGFNREDVVQYIEFINNRHTIQVNQLKSELATVREELAAANARVQDTAELETALHNSLNERDQLQAQLAAAAAETDLQEQLAAAQEELAAVKQQLEQTIAQVEQKASRSAELELETYRRAERFERMAMERVSQMYVQANTALEQATVNSQDTADQIGQMADSVSDQLLQMQAMLEKSKQTIQGVAEAMKAIRPIETEC